MPDSRPADPTPGAGPCTVPPLDPETACRVVNAYWAIIASRLPWKSHVQRLKDLEAAGLVHDETWFARHGEPAA
jgi:hypothetical protein